MKVFDDVRRARRGFLKRSVIAAAAMGAGTVEMLSAHRAWADNGHGRGRRGSSYGGAGARYELNKIKRGAS